MAADQPPSLADGVRTGGDVKVPEAQRSSATMRNVCLTWIPAPSAEGRATPGARAVGAHIRISYSWSQTFRHGWNEWRGKLLR